MGAALLERRRIPEKSGILPNLPIAERGPRGRYELQNHILLPGGHALWQLALLLSTR